MKREDYLKDYYKTLEETPINILEEYEVGVLSAIEDSKAAGDEKKAQELENDLNEVRELLEKRRKD